MVHTSGAVYHHKSFRISEWKFSAFAINKCSTKRRSTIALHNVPRSKKYRRKLLLNKLGTCVGIRNFLLNGAKAMAVHSQCSWKLRELMRRIVYLDRLNIETKIFIDPWNMPYYVRNLFSLPYDLWIILFTVSVWTLNRASLRCRCMWIKIINRTFFAMHLGIGKVYIASGRKRSWFTEGVRIDAECPSSGNQ